MGALTLRLRGGELASACDATSAYRTPSSERKQRIVRAMSTGQDVNAALTLRLRGGELASACDATSDYRTPSSERKQRIVRAMSTGQAVALVKHTASDVLPCVGAAEDLRPTRMDYRKRRILRAMSSGQAVTRRMYC